MPNLAGKVALITGASSGIGAGTAVLFASLGCKLTLTGRSEKRLQEVAEKCRKKGLAEGSICLVTGDLTIEDEARKVVQKSMDHHGTLDILVNNAGILKAGTVQDTALDVFDYVMNVNVRSVFHMMQLAIPHILKSKGNIVNVSSVNGLRSFAGVSVYNMSKSAVDQLTRSAALELAPQQVRVNAVNPGVIVTELQKTGGLSEEQYAKFLEHSKTTHALGRPGEVGEVATAIAFLASEDSSFITGATLPVDGGRNLICPR